MNAAGSRVPPAHRPGTSLRTRITLLVAAVVALAVVGGAYAAHVSASQALRNETDKFLRDRAANFTNQPQPVGGFPAAPGGPGGDQDDDRGRFFDYDAVTQLLDRTGHVTQTIPGGTGQPTLPVTAADRAVAAHGGSAEYRDVTVGGVHYRMVTTPLRSGGAVEIARSTSEQQDILGVLRDRLVVIALLGIALATVVAWLVGRRISRPVRQLTATAEHIAATEDLTTPIPVQGDDEVGRLAGAFNTMLAALAASREQQRRLVMDASHELRTPLTVVRTNIDFLAHAPELDAGERAQLVDETRLELEELTNIVTEMVELATNARSEEPIEPVDLAEVADEVVQRFRRRSGRDVRLTLEAPAVVQGRRGMLGRAVSNLVDNALKFSATPAPVDVAVLGASVEVADRGPGIAAADAPHVFDRFYRAPEARTLPGSGLGLSIVAQIVELHGGRVTVQPRDGGGTVVQVDLGRAAAPHTDARSAVTQRDGDEIGASTEATRARTRAAARES